jgi:hypothetical protein
MEPDSNGDRSVLRNLFSLAVSVPGGGDRRRILKRALKTLSIASLTPTQMLLNINETPVHAYHAPTGVISSEYGQAVSRVGAANSIAFSFFTRIQAVAQLKIDYRRVFLSLVTPACTLPNLS